MINLRVSKRYAKALLNLAKDENLLRVAYGDMYNVNKTILLNKELRLLLKSPIINADLKIKTYNTSKLILRSPVTYWAHVRFGTIQGGAPGPRDPCLS